MDRPSTVPLLAALTLVLAPPALATWSIVLVDPDTGQIGVASATCLENFDLRKNLPVIVVGKGGGVAQSALDSSGANRQKIWDELHAGTTPIGIINKLKEGDPQKCSRQYGIVDMEPKAAAFTGACALAHKDHVKGSVGNMKYSIQGNILTGQPVIDATRAAVIDTPGGVGDKLMAGMEAARALGGDGRCSCDENNATGCGVPPADFDKSAHVGFVIIARMGDVDGSCNAAFGCASGDYWLSLNVIGGPADPDPVPTLQDLYDAAIADKRGRPDGVTSVWTWDDGQVLGLGTDVRTLQVALADVDGVPLTRGVDSVQVDHAPGSAGLATVVGVTDNGDGTYDVDVQAGVGEGTDLFELRFDDGVEQATLFPYPALEHRVAMVADAGSLSAGAGGAVGFDLLGPDASAGRTFALGLSMTGTTPGQVLGVGLPVGLNLDRLFVFVPDLVDAGVIVGAPGTLDGQSRAAVSLAPPPGFLGPLEGFAISAAWFTTRPVDFASNSVDIAVDP